MEGPWLGTWNFQGKQLRARCPHCIKQNVFHDPLSKIKPFYIYPSFIISWINIGLGNIEGPWLGGWNFQGTLLGARCHHCIKQNVFSVPLSKTQPFHMHSYFIISWINNWLGNIQGPWLRGSNFDFTLLGARCPHCIKQNVFCAPLSKIQPFHIYPILLYLEYTSGS
jgi:hypothetical protein